MPPKSASDIIEQIVPAGTSVPSEVVSDGYIKDGRLHSTPQTEREQKYREILTKKLHNNPSSLVVLQQWSEEGLLTIEANKPRATVQSPISYTTVGQNQLLSIASTKTSSDELAKIYRELLVERICTLLLHSNVEKRNNIARAGYIQQMSTQDLQTLNKMIPNNVQDSEQLSDAKGFIARHALNQHEEKFIKEVEDHLSHKWFGRGNEKLAEFKKAVSEARQNRKEGESVLDNEAVKHAVRSSKSWSGKSVQSETTTSAKIMAKFKQAINAQKPRETPSSADNQSEKSAKRPLPFEIGRPRH